MAEMLQIMKEKRPCLFLHK